MRIGQYVNLKGEWQGGDEIGVIVGFRRGFINVRLNVSNRIVRFSPDELVPLPCCDSARISLCHGNCNDN